MIEESCPWLGLTALRVLLRKPVQVYQEVVRPLIVAGQAAGEVAQGDPDQLVIALIACLNGLSRLALQGGEHMRAHFPETEIILRMLKA